MNKNIIIIVLFLTFGLEAIENEEMIFSGYLRGTYHTHDIEDDKKYVDDAIGGKLHFETASYEGFTLGASLYTTHQVFYNDNNPFIALRGEHRGSYASLGEFYVKSGFANTLVTIGRQELNTPFADMDDVGMVPNTFEAVTLVNRDIEKLEVYLGQINKMAGVGAAIVDKFTAINGSKGMQVLGLNYDDFEGINLAFWYNRLQDAELDAIIYGEFSYENNFDSYVYALALQYAHQSYENTKDAKIWGVKLELRERGTGLLLSTAYNTVKDNVANSGFGGGPFFASSEFLLIDNAKKNGSATSIILEYDASVIGFLDLTLGVGKMYIETAKHEKSSEIDIALSYDIDEKTDIHMAYIKLDGQNIGVAKGKHFQVYVNHHF